MQETLPNAQQGNGWGMTELTGSVSAANGMIFAAKPDSCGFLSPVMDVRTVDANGNVLPAGALGEFELRGPHVMLGYWNAKAETAAVLRDGWLATGDMGYIDEDDFIYLVDRKKDMVICAGENIFCGEVEKVISSDPRVEEVALFGVPDDRLGERTVAAVNFRLAQSANADELARLVANHLADYKVPREFVLGLGPFPRNGIGKVDKRRLRTAYLELQHSL
jgi:acyl-CoA synthetase (AMP-forming)/AMP-acid ligase II